MLRLEGRMAERAGAPGSAAGSGYPDPALADLCVQLLASLPGNEFDVYDALGGPQRNGTRSAGTDTPCCVVHSTAVADGPFYFGKDRAGYILIRARRPVPQWPTSKDKRLLPLRLTRWLAGAPSGLVCRHACDNPGCVRMSHLILGQQAENLADCRRRKRHPSPLLQLNHFPSTARSPATAATDRHNQSAAIASTSAPPSASERSALASPSKAARKRARAALAAARAAEGRDPTADLAHALAEAQGPTADAEG